jgi:hypothetical protein
MWRSETRSIPHSTSHDAETERRERLPWTCDAYCAWRVQRAGGLRRVSSANLLYG